MKTPVSMLLFLFSCISLLCPVLCRFDVSIQRTLINNGFHQEISSDIDSFASDVIYPCSLLLVEYLPRGIYVDSEQLYALGNQNKILAYANMTVNTEVVASNYRAEPFKVFIFLSDQDTPKYTQTINLPIHLRYQDASVEGGYKSVLVGQPSLFSKCEGSEESTVKFDLPCSYLDKSMCKWIKLSPTISTASLSASVPVGSTKYVLYIEIAQFLLVYTAVIYIARKIYQKRI